MSAQLAASKRDFRILILLFSCSLHGRFAGLWPALTNVKNTGLLDRETKLANLPTSAKSLGRMACLRLYLNICHF
jgi:hypothetical protein